MLTENQSLEYRPTLFWYLEDGFGINLQVDYDNRFSRRFVGRRTTSGTYSETTLGVLWWSSVSIYQALEETRGAALLFKVWVNGETEAPVDLTDYGFYRLYRRNMWRNWFYLLAGPGIHWPRAEIDEVRDASLGPLSGSTSPSGRSRESSSNTSEHVHRSELTSHWGRVSG